MSAVMQREQLSICITEASSAIARLSDRFDESAMIKRALLGLGAYCARRAPQYFSAARELLDAAEVQAQGGEEIDLVNAAEKIIGTGDVYTSAEQKAADAAAFAATGNADYAYKTALVAIHDFAMRTSRSFPTREIAIAYAEKCMEGARAQMDAEIMRVYCALAIETDPYSIFGD